jgi:hypothetical protein
MNALDISKVERPESGEPLYKLRLWRELLLPHFKYQCTLYFPVS